jgi:hypothetical protein
MLPINGKTVHTSLTPIQLAVGVPNGMDFITKNMQLSIEKFIIAPQQRNELHHVPSFFLI